jgi:uncharacterized protein (TIGR03083 family)
MDDATHRTALAREGQALFTIAADHLDQVVPSCPEWTVAEMVGHVGEVHRFWERVAAEGLQEVGDSLAVTVPPPDEVLAWYAEGLEQLLATIAAADLDRTVWTWTGPQPTRWILRRMAQETAVHRVDAELAAGPRGPIAPDLAVDGIDEYLRVFVPAEDKPYDGPVGRLHLHATDADGEWIVDLAPNLVTVADGHERGDAAVRAPADALLLLLWRRVEVSEVEILGDAGLLRALLELPDLD